MTEDRGIVVGDDGLAHPAWASADPLPRDYCDTEWSMPVRDDRGMFERLRLGLIAAVGSAMALPGDEWFSQMVSTPDLIKQPFRRRCTTIT